MKNSKKMNQGITLIALVVTIVVLLILAGVTITLVFSDGGIINQAQKSKEQTRIGELLDKFNVSEATISLEKLGKPSLEDFINQVQNKEGYIVEAEKEGDKNYTVTTEDGYVFDVSIIEGTDINDIIIEYIGKDGNIGERLVKSITLNKASLSLAIGNTTTLLATVKPDNADHKEVTWDSSNKEVATVSNTGTITALTSGETTISVTANDKSGKIASCKVTVMEEGAIPYSWEELGKIANAISNITTYNESTTNIKVTVDGEEKSLKVGDWTRIDGRRVRILGFNHDLLAEGESYEGESNTGKAGISFEYLDCLMENTAMDPNNANTNGWIEKPLYQTLNTNSNAKYKDLQAKGVPIKKVQKTYNVIYNKADTKTSEDYLWLLSCSEIWGYSSVSSSCASGYSKAEEGKQYAFYSSLNPKPVYDIANTNIVHYSIDGKSKVYCWLRSLTYDSFNYFCYTDSGNCQNNGAWIETISVAPGFSI